MPSRCCARNANESFTPSGSCTYTAPRVRPSTWPIHVVPHRGIPSSRTLRTIERVTSARRFLDRRRTHCPYFQRSRPTLSARPDARISCAASLPTAFRPTRQHPRTCRSTAGPLVMGPASTSWAACSSRCCSHWACVRTTPCATSAAGRCAPAVSSSRTWRRGTTTGSNRAGKFSTPASSTKSVPICSRKREPHFDYGEDFGLARFDTSFDFVLAQSIFSHTYRDLAEVGLRGIASSLAADGLLVATVFERFPVVLPQGNAHAPDDDQRVAVSGSRRVHVARVERDGARCRSYCETNPMVPSAPDLVHCRPRGPRANASRGLAACEQASPRAGRVGACRTSSTRTCARRQAATRPRHSHVMSRAPSVRS